MGCQVEVEVRGELNELLHPDRRHRPFPVEVAAGTTVKDLAESVGIPHTEIDVIVVNGTSVPFGHQVGASDRVTIGATAGGLGISPVIHLLPPTPARPRFVLDVHLGRLARILRLLGFDAEWLRDASDEVLVQRSVQEQRILLTRDRALLKRSAVTSGYYVRQTERLLQAAEVLRRFDLFGAIDPFGRCLACNGLLEPVAKRDVEDQLPPRTRRDYTTFRRCASCHRVYWQGSHYDRLAQVVRELRREGARPGRSLSARA